MHVFREHCVTSASQVNPFVDEVHFVFGTMVGWDVECVDIRTKEDWAPTKFVSGIISLHGEFSGLVALGVSTRTACCLTETLLQRPVSSVNDDVVDAMRELTNMISGRAAPQISKRCTRVGVPQVVIGRARTFAYPQGTNPIVIEFLAHAESIVLEIGLCKLPDSHASPSAAGAHDGSVVF